MRQTTVATLAGLLLTIPVLATPAVAQVPNVQQLLQGLLSGNQGQDQSLQEAFERGYQRGREDEARRLRSERGRDGRAVQEQRRPRQDDAEQLDSGEYDRDRRSNRDERGPSRPDSRPADGYYSR